MVYSAPPRGSGGIGRRASLRSWWPKGRRGSSPFFRMKNFGARLEFTGPGSLRPRRGAIDARLRIAYTDVSVAVHLGRSSLPSSFSDSEQAKGRLETGRARVCFSEKIT